MRSLLEDWRLLVTQLEHQHLIGQLNLPVSTSTSSHYHLLSLLQPAGGVVSYREFVWHHSIQAVS